MTFDDNDLKTALAAGLAATDPGTRAKAFNLLIEQGVSDARRVFFEAEPFGAMGATWADLSNRQTDYVRQYVKTSIAQPHTFQEAMSPNDVGDIDEAQMIVRLESLAGPMAEFGCTFEQLRDAHEDEDTDFLEAFCEVWNDKRDFRPAFSTLLSEVDTELDRDDWADALRDRLGLAHYSPTGLPLPVALCRYSVADVHREAVTGVSITMPTVFDSDPWEYYFPAPVSLQFGRAMALTPCHSDEDLKLELLNSRVTYAQGNIWRIGQIMTPMASSDIKELREHHLLAVQFAAGDLGFGT